MTANEDEQEPGPGPFGDPLPPASSDDYLLAGLIDGIKFQYRIVGPYLRRHPTVSANLRDAIAEMRSDIDVQVVTDVWRA